jgi:hypothetical protein
MTTAVVTPPAITSPAPPTPAPAELPLVPVAQLNKYLKQLAVVFFDSDAALIDKSLTDAAPILTKFISDAKQPTLSMQYVPGGVVDTGASAAAGAPSGADARQQTTAATISLTLDVTFVDTRAQTILLVKREGQLVSKDSQNRDVPVASQLQVVNLGGSPLESLHSCVHGALAPLFNAFVRVNESTRKDAGFNAVQAVKQKMDELEVTLYNAKQNAQIETVVLEYHPEVRAAAARAAVAGRTLKPDDLADRIGDTEFLNQLQANVNSWIAKIERVTKIER